MVHRDANAIHWSFLAVFFHFFGIREGILQQNLQQKVSLYKQSLNFNILLPDGFQLLPDITKRDCHGCTVNNRDLEKKRNPINLGQASCQV